MQYCGFLKGTTSLHTLHAWFQPGTEMCSSNSPASEDTETKPVARKRWTLKSSKCSVWLGERKLLSQRTAWCGVQQSPPGLLDGDSVLFAVRLLFPLCLGVRLRRPHMGNRSALTLPSRGPLSCFASREQWSTWCAQLTGSIRCVYNCLFIYWLSMYSLCFSRSPEAKYKQRQSRANFIKQNPEALGQCQSRSFSSISRCC